MASCSCSRRGFAGITCQPTSALVRGRPAGEDCATGTRLACGTGCTNCCSRSCAKLASSIFLALLPILRRCKPVGREKNWPDPRGPRTTQFEVPHPRRCKRRSSERDPDWREPERCHPVAAACRGDSSDSRRTWSATSEAQNYLRQSRLRFRTSSSVSSRARNQARNSKASDWTSRTPERCCRPSRSTTTTSPIRIVP